VLGSLEYAVDILGTPLIMVLAMNAVVLSLPQSKERLPGLYSFVKASNLLSLRQKVESDDLI